MLLQRLLGCLLLTSACAASRVTCCYGCHSCMCHMLAGKLNLEYLRAWISSMGADGRRRGGRLGRRVEKKKEQIAKVQLNSRSKEELKTVALGTSKINYLDPRITIAWCKANEVPLEKARPRRALPQQTLSL